MDKELGIMILTDSLMPISCSPSAVGWLSLLRWLERIQLCSTGGSLRTCQTIRHPPAYCRGHALSAREKQIADYIFRGYSTKELVDTLHISAYTVQDHLKSIFAKTGVKSRRELIWLLFSRYSLDSRGLRCRQ